MATSLVRFVGVLNTQSRTVHGYAGGIVRKLKLQLTLPLGEKEHRQDRRCGQTPAGQPMLSEMRRSD